MAIHRSIYPSHPQTFQLFSDQGVWALSVVQYLELFTSPLPLGGYATMVVSTAGHWTTTLFSGYDDESRQTPDSGLMACLRSLMRQYHDDRGFRDAGGLVVTTQQPEIGRPATKRRVSERSYFLGHEDWAAREPSQEIQLFVWNWYNRGYVEIFNRVFEKLLVERAKLPDDYHLPIDGSARPRPDAMTYHGVACIMTGVGGLEDWTRIISGTTFRNRDKLKLVDTK